MALTGSLRKLGRWCLDQVDIYLQVATLAMAAGASAPALLGKRSAPIQRVAFKQLYFTGFESLKVILPTSLFLGTAIIAQVNGLIGSGNAPLVGKILVWTVLRELGPLLTAIIMIARSGAAVTAELGTMSVNREILSLETMGVDLHAYLVLPRVLAFSLAAMLLTVYFELGAVLGGFAISSLSWGVPFEQFSQGIYAALDFREVLVSLFKGFLFGALIGLICVQQGLAVGTSPVMIPRAASRGVINSLFAIFLSNGVVSLLSFY